MTPLETSRLILRNFTGEDWQAIHAYQKEQFKGRYWDVLLYSILEDEWRAIVPQNKTLPKRN